MYYGRRHHIMVATIDIIVIVLYGKAAQLFVITF